MTPEYILRASLSRGASCGSGNAITDKRRAESEIDCMQYAHAYGEPGYTDPKKAILFANWNYFCKEVYNLLGKAGYALEWSDEWSTCNDCGNAVRTSADSYSWQPFYAIVND